jgi:hypothetical protein
MRKLILVAAGLGAATLFSAAAEARHGQAARELREVQRECRIALSRADTRREFRFIQRQCRIEIAEARREYFLAERRHARRFDRFDDDDFDWRGRRGRHHGRDHDDDHDDDD